MFKPYHKFILSLFKEAARDIQEYFPEWVKNHPKMNEVENLSDITKKIPISNYREKIELKSDQMKVNDREVRLKNLEDLQTDVISLIIKADKEINSSNIEYKYIFFILTDAIGRIFYRNNLIDDTFKTEKINSILITSSDEKITFDVETPKGKLPKTIFMPNGTNIRTACKLLLDSMKKYLPDTNLSQLEKLNDISQLDSYKRFAYTIGKKFKDQMQNLSKDQFEIVFSTDPKDILSMSSRSDWTSCQNLMKEEDSNNIKAIYSAVSPYVGIIYLTNKKNYQSRGEEMVARSTVFYVENLDNNGALVINKVYSNLDKQIILNVFSKSLSSHASLPIIDSKDAYSLGYHFPTKNWNEIPYFDEPLGIKEEI